MTTTTTSVETILAELTEDFGAAFERIRWAEDEISRASARHPEHADRLFHSFRLLNSGDATGRMGVEEVYRAHARELLERIANGEDTRPGTAVEVIIGLLAAAQVAPLNHEGFGLCARLWAGAGLPDIDGFTDQMPHLEALHAARLDSEEAHARRACRDDDRSLGSVECDGLHHGERVPCVYAG